MSTNGKETPRNPSRRTPAAAGARTTSRSSAQKSAPRPRTETKAAATRKKTNEPLLGKSELSDDIINSLPGIFYIYDEHGSMVRWNQRAVEISGYPADELPRLHPLDFFEGEDRVRVERAVRKVFADGAAAVAATLITRTGRRIPYHFTVKRMTLGGRDYMVGMGIDRASQRRTEETLRETERRLTMALEGARADAWEWHVTTNTAAWSRENCQVLGLRPGSCAPSYDAWLQCVHPEDRVRASAAVARVVAERTDLNIEFRVVRPDGSVRWINDRGKLQYDAAGKPVRMLGVRIDITERKRAEEERSRLLNILERSLNEVYIFDPESLRFRYANAGALRNLGYSREQIESMTPVDIKPQFTDTSFRELIGPLLDGRKDKEVFHAEHRRADSSLYPVEVHLQLVEHEKERMFLAVIIDITERKRAEEERKKLQAQLLHSQKMEAVGQLAGGIAHDFNNILTAIIGYGNVALMSTDEDHPVRPYIDQMLSAADRAAALTQSLLAFSRRQIINPRAVSASSIIARVQKLLHRIIGEDITLTTAFTEEDDTVLVDAGQIEQILINLCANARDAMPNGGHLTIGTSHAAIGEDYIRAHGYGKIGDYMLITVTDDGQGMDEQTRQRIFEPFFTTKEVGKGTGLGLAMAYGIVKQHSGYINVESRPGRGTTFRVYLPRHRAAFASDAASEAAPPPRGGTETVLLAEDDAQIRKLSRSVLEDFGYTVIEAVDGADAVQKFREHRDRVQIIVVDVVMPKKNGREVYEAARRIKPGVKVLFMSGYPSNVIASKGVLEPGITLLPKPLAPQDLLRAVRSTLDV